MISVLVVTPWFPNRPGDRQGNFIYDSVSALARNGLTVGVVITRPFVPKMLEGIRPAWERDRFEPQTFGEFAQVRRVVYPRVPRNWLWRVNQWFHDWSVNNAIDVMASSLQPSIIHTHTEGEAETAVRAQERYNIPAVVTLHGINTGRRYFSTARRARFSRSLRAVDRVILVGEPLRPFFCAITGNDGNFTTIPNGVTVATRSPKYLFSNEMEPVRFISVSNLHEGKGIDIALKALADVCARGFANWDYTIVGDGTERQAWTALAQALGITEKVRFLGVKSHNEVLALLDEADVFLLPSYREAFGIAYLEAMAAGLLAIGVAGQGPSAFIADRETGFLVPPCDPIRLADCLMNLSTNRNAARRVAAEGAERARNKFTWDHHARQLISVYEQAIANRPSR
jgi:glycosyltransferase involved in cell wall biosynthesis